MSDSREKKEHTIYEYKVKLQRSHQANCGLRRRFSVMDGITLGPMGRRNAGCRSWRAKTSKWTITGCWYFILRCQIFSFMRSLMRSFCFPGLDICPSQGVSSSHSTFAGPVNWCKHREWTGVLWHSSAQAKVVPCRMEGVSELTEESLICDEEVFMLQESFADMLPANFGVPRKMVYDDWHGRIPEVFPYVQLSQCST